ncbi:hypothetical protein Goshw_026014, partial [Gossypium schwendimanii]|nr:hypothetical protein [Gossypium schwendimanii]
IYVTKKSIEVGSSHIKACKKSSNARGVVKLYSQINILCNAANDMSQATSVLDSLLEEVPKASPLSGEPEWGFGKGPDFLK